MYTRILYTNVRFDNISLKFENKKCVKNENIVLDTQNEILWRISFLVCRLLQTNKCSNAFVTMHTVFSEPIFFDKTPITDDRDTLQLQLLLAEPYQFANILASMWQKRLSSTEVYLHHSYTANNCVITSSSGIAERPRDSCFVYLFVYLFRSS